MEGRGEGLWNVQAEGSGPGGRQSRDGGRAQWLRRRPGRLAKHMLASCASSLSLTPHLSPPAGPISLTSRLRPEASSSSALHPSTLIQTPHLSLALLQWPSAGLWLLLSNPAVHSPHRLSFFAHDQCMFLLNFSWPLE